MAIATFSHKKLFLKKMSANAHQCPYCGRHDFKTQRGLTRHQNTSDKCKRLKDAKFGLQSVEMNAAFFMQPQPISFPKPASVAAVFNKTGPNIKASVAKDWR